MKTICPCCGLEHCAVGDELDSLNKKLEESANLIKTLVLTTKDLQQAKRFSSHPLVKIVKDAELWLSENGDFKFDGSV